jgi:trans-aconitate methyltransferase
MDDWDPELYHRFRGYRAEPVERIFTRLILERAHNVVDLGCGTGEHTVELARRAPDANALGLDSSAAMIERASSLRSALDAGLQARGSAIIARFSRNVFARCAPAAALRFRCPRTIAKRRR